MKEWITDPAAASVKYVLGVPIVANDKLLFVGNRSFGK